MKIIILDTETTGIDEEDRICQLSYLVLNDNGEIEEVHNEFCMPPLPLKISSMAIHHITPEMLEGTPECIQTKAYQRLCELNISENIMVIQNAQFDLDMLAKEGFELKMVLIDTFRVIRYLYPMSNSNGLQYKRYEFGLYKKEQAIIDKLGVEIKAHDALGDVIVLKNLFDHLKQEMDTVKMIELCYGPILLEYMPFGKYRGGRIEELALNERGTLEYMLENFDLDSDMFYTLTHFMEITKEKVVLVVGFGKHKGKTPAEIVETDRGYLEWMRDKADSVSNELREEIINVLAS